MVTAELNKKEGNVLVRAYTYKCDRCGELFDEDELAEDAELVADSIYVYTIPDPMELNRLLQAARLADVLVLEHGKRETAWHECKDEGLGIARVVGCSKAYEVDSEALFQ